jgi:hypothetical protein
MGLLPFKAFAALLFLLFSWQLFDSLRRMEVRMRRGSGVRSDERPKLFWALIALQCWAIFFSLAAVIFIPYSAAR